MSAPRVTTAPKVVAVTEASPADLAGLRPGDELLSLNGRSPRDVIEYSLLVDEPDLDLVVRRRGHADPLDLRVAKEPGEPLGAEVSSAVFDRVRTCDNHCEFCFIHQLPKGMRRSLSLKDDDYRLSFLYGNFTTLTRFTEMDLERVLTERLSPLFVSIHATDPDVRAEMLRNRRGAVSLRWLGALLDGGIEVHGQVVVCPGKNDGAVLEDTLAGVLDRYPSLATVACVPLGVSRFSHESAMRPHSRIEAAAVCDTVERWQDTFLSALGRRHGLRRRRVLPDGRATLSGGTHLRGLPSARERPGHGPGLRGRLRRGRAGSPRGACRASSPPWTGPRPPATGRPASRTRPDTTVDRAAPIAILTGEYGARVLGPLVGSLGRDDIRLVPVANHFFGGNIGVSGLLTGTDLIPVLAAPTGGAPLPPARRLPVRGAVPRRPDPVRPAAAGRGRAHRRALPPPGPRIGADPPSRRTRTVGPNGYRSPWARPR